MHVILTNNPDVATAYPGLARYHESTVMGVFTATRDAIHGGALLISHPLSGSIKPTESPYKSVIISQKKGSLHYKSLQIIEDAISLLARLPGKNYTYDESILKDFRIIDLDLINSGDFV